MGVKTQVEGFQAYLEKLQEMEKLDGPLFIFFTGSLDSITGHSWCPDCVVADPLIEKQLSKSPEVNFLKVLVGQREYWKDPQCDFRTHPELKLKSIPTLIKWKTPVKLEGCNNPDTIAMAFEEEN